MNDQRAALFVRLPAPLLSQLEPRIQNDGRTKQAVVEDLLASQLLGGKDRQPDDEILDLPTVADLFRVSQHEVLERIVDGDFPARRFGDQWRCSRTAVLLWLSGTDPITPRSTGFSSG